MFDDSVWLTLFSAATGATEPFPKTLRFSERSFLYTMERTHFLHVCNSRLAHHYVITPDTSRQEFLHLFGRVTGTPLTDSGLDRLAGRFRAFQREFSTTADLSAAEPRS
jgi:hypothetical protein